MVSQKYDIVNYPTINTIKLVSRRIKKFVELNDKIPNSNATLTRFHSKHVAPISIEAYLNRILKYTLCGNECFLSVLVYFHRMSQIQNYIPSFPSSCKKNKKPFIINSYNVHRLLIAGITVSAKFNSDIFFLNSHYAKVGGLPITELNCLEMDFLMLNNYDLHVSVEELQYTGDCLLNNTLPDPVIINGIKHMELLSQPVFFNKNINKFALTYEDTILIEKKNRDEERKYGRAARLIQNSLYEKSKSERRDREKSKDYRLLKYSKSFDIVKANKKEKLEEAYRYHNSHQVKPPMNGNPSYQHANSYPYKIDKRNDYNSKSDYIRNHSSHSGNEKRTNSFVNSNSHLSYRHSTNSINLSRYQEKLELQNKLKNSALHDPIRFTVNGKDKEENLRNMSISSENLKNSEYKYERKFTPRGSTREFDDNSLKTNIKTYLEPNEQISGSMSEKYQKAYNAYKERYMKEIMLKNKSSFSSQVPVDNPQKADILTTDNDGNLHHVSSKEKSRYKLKKANVRLNSTSSVGNESFNTTSTSSFLDSETDQYFYHGNEPYTSGSPYQRLHYRQGLNPPQSSNHRVSHLDLNQARKNYSRKQSMSTIPAENIDDSNELSSPKPNNSYKVIKGMNVNLSKSLPQPPKKVSEYKSFSKEFNNPQDDSLLTTGEESFLTATNGSSLLSSDDKPNESSQRRPTKDKKNTKEKVHKRLSRNLSRMFNIKSDGDKENEKGKETDKEKEDENEKEKETNTARVRKGVKLVERKIKGLSLSHLLKQNKSGEESDDDLPLKERHSFSVLSLNHSDRQKLKLMGNSDSSIVSKKEASENHDSIKSTEKRLSKHLQKYILKDKVKDKPSKKLKEEKPYDSSKRYYETLTDILKRNKDNSKNNDYSTYLNDIDIKVSSNSNDTINQLTDIYHSYTEDSNEFETENSTSNIISDTTFGHINKKTEPEHFTPSKKEKMAMSKNKVLPTPPKYNDSSFNGTPVSFQSGEFDDTNEQTSSSENNKLFHHNVYDFDKYYHDDSNSDNRSSLKEGDVEISSSNEIINSFDLNIINEKNKKQHHDSSFDLIKKNHSYSSTDIYSYYSNMNSGKNNSEKSSKKGKKSLGKEKILDKVNNTNTSNSKIDAVPNEVQKEKSNLSESTQMDHDRHLSESNSNSPTNSPSKLEKNNTYSNTEEYENEIHNINNFLEQQNETINADLSKLSNDENEITNISSFATSVPSTYISSSAKEDKCFSSIDEEGSELEDEEVCLTRDMMDDNIESIKEKMSIIKNEDYVDVDVDLDDSHSKLEHDRYYKPLQFNDYYHLNEKRSSLSYTSPSSSPINDTTDPASLNEKTSRNADNEKDYHQGTTEEVTEAISEPNQYKPLKELRGPTYRPSEDVAEDQQHHPQHSINQLSLSASSSPSSHDPNDSFIKNSAETYLENYNNKTKALINQEKKSPFENDQKFGHMNNLKNNIMRNDKIDSIINSTAVNNNKSQYDTNSKNFKINHNIQYFRSSSEPSLLIRNKNSIDSRLSRGGSMNQNHIPFSLNDSDSDISKRNRNSTTDYNIIDLNRNSNHRESFQNLLKRFQKNCKIENQEEILATLRKQYRPHSSDSINTMNSDRTNPSFNDILEHFKKNCERANEIPQRRTTITSTKNLSTLDLPTESFATTSTTHHATTSSENIATISNP